ncbi:MAG: tRNA uridine-5-carboxymethylaminomethyl(34) synthesis GTPase MnmE [Oscillospiraceae bacterium]|nr:tRNA uridine-5-carboxymethylaminomethyl(34) synthesis GTPase MnmE [Oscillospiraceae bacterium]
MADTIAAIATGGVISAIGIIRLSGDAAIEIADKVFKSYTGKKMSEMPDRKLAYGELYDENGDVLDICLCTVSRGPGSYTGEHTAEFQCHGSPVVLAAGLQALFAAGARQALAGEFTKRAFLNGRMDLSQAEAVIDIIDAETVSAAKNAAGQLGGAIGRRADAIYSELVDIMAHFHAVLDYPDEDIEEFTLESYVGTLEASENILKNLLATYERGRIMKEGVKCAIIGRPNAGKSSLLNTLVGYDRAIVTDIAGTTRDTIEEKIKIGNVVLRLVDTAGIRETDDVVERIGVERSVAAAQEAELVIAVFDGADKFSDEDREVLARAKEATKSMIVVNKADIANSSVPEELCGMDLCIVSAVTGQGIGELENRITNMFDSGVKIPAGEVLTNARHADAIKRALGSIVNAKTAMEMSVTPDAVLTEIEDALAAIGEITGRTMRDDVTDRIFSRFCVGK